MTLERDTLEHNHLVITVGFLERLLQDLLGVLPIAAKVLLESASHTRGCFAQTISIRILANPVKNSSKRSFYVFLRRAFAPLPARIGRPEWLSGRIMAFITTLKIGKQVRCCIAGL
jgi:hypothetical protein